MIHRSSLSLAPDGSGGAVHRLHPTTSQLMAHHVRLSREANARFGIEEVDGPGEDIEPPDIWKMFAGFPRRAQPVTPPASVLQDIPLLARWLGGVAVFDGSLDSAMTAGWTPAARAPAGFTNEAWPGTMLLPVKDGALLLMRRFTNPRGLELLRDAGHHLLGNDAEARAIVTGPLVLSVPIMVDGPTAGDPVRGARVPSSKILSSSAEGVPFEVRLAYTKVTGRAAYGWIRAIVGDGLFTSDLEDRRIPYLHDLHRLRMLEGKNKARFFGAVAQHLVNVTKDVLEHFAVLPDRAPRDGYRQVGVLHAIGAPDLFVVPELHLRDGGERLLVTGDPPSICAFSNRRERGALLAYLRAGHR